MCIRDSYTRMYSKPKTVAIYCCRFLNARTHLHIIVINIYPLPNECFQVIIQRVLSISNLVQLTLLNPYHLCREPRYFVFSLLASTLINVTTIYYHISRQLSCHFNLIILDMIASTGAIHLIVFLILLVNSV